MNVPFGRRVAEQLQSTIKMERTIRRSSARRKLFVGRGLNRMVLGLLAEGYAGRCSSSYLRVISDGARTIISGLYRTVL